MQSKGAIKTLAIVMALVCMYHLSFTWVTSSVEKKAQKFAKGNELKVKEYLDSVASQPVYNLGFVKFTYRECKEREMNLGLDLKGGMNVTMEVSVVDIIKAMSGNNPDSTFNAALNLALKKQENSQKDFVTLFGESYSELNPKGKLSAIFGTYEMREKIKPTTSNAEVLKIIQEQSQAAVDNSFNVLRNRIDRFGVTQPNVQKLGSTGRILVELPGVKEPERVRKLLQGTANLEFWETYDNAEIFAALSAANEKIKEYESAGKLNKPAAAADTAAKTAGVQKATAAKPQAAKQKADAKGDDASELVAKLAKDTTKATAQAAAQSKQADQYPLFAVLNPSVDQKGTVAPGPRVGMARGTDINKINAWLDLPTVKTLFPRDLRFMWTIKAIDKGNTIYELIAIKCNTRDGKAPLDGSVVVDARPEYSGTSANAEVSMVMNAEGARTWARMTADNVGKSIAIVLDGYVYSYPRVNGEIKGGRSAITGGFSIEEAKDLANVLKSGKLPAPARIIQESVVGPSLGHASIQAGFRSFVLAFVLVLLYMGLFYNRSGWIANIALVANVFFLMGILASLGAVLTLPGIAGIVLTMGMAVDANVIIYERIKEELKAGKGLQLAVDDGYKHAYSAIIDGNLTTIITGIVLYIFGSGPIQGFATTLVIGIITSFFTSVFISRLIFIWMMGKRKNISFSNKATENFLKGFHFDFIKMRKYAYAFSITLMVIGTGSLIFKGLSYGVDFTGGRTYVVKFDKKISEEAVREATRMVIADEKGASVEVKAFGTGGNQVKITTDYLYKDRSEKADNTVERKLYDAVAKLFAKPMPFEQFVSTMDNPYGIISSEKVGPTIADNIKMDASIAVLFSLLAIFLYIVVRFKRWPFGLGAVIAETHDAFMVIAAYSIFSGLMPFSLDVDQSFIAAVLTVIGYSINDTVIIFDRIRENLKLYPKHTLEANINDAINSTMTRSVNTTGTTAVVLLAIFLFGGEVIQGFTFALLAGIIFGTYSSVFVATPLAYEFLKRKQLKEAAKK